MKTKALLALLLAAFLPSVTVSAQDAAPAATAPAGDPAGELKALVADIQAKLRAGKRSEEDLRDELSKFDALFAKYRDQKSEEVARILFMQATLYGEVLRNSEKARTLLVQLKDEFPNTHAAANADRTLATIERRASAQQTQAALVGKPAPELHFKWANRDGLKTLSDLKGKVVVLDFWATWCGPCVASFPQVRELTAHYKDMDVVVVGVTSIQGKVHGLESKPIDVSGDPAKEMALMNDYIKAKDITWTIAFSEEEVFNKDYGVTGIPHMAIIAPDGTVRHTGLHPALPHAEKVSKIDAILKEFGKPILASSPNE